MNADELYSIAEATHPSRKSPTFRRLITCGYALPDGTILRDKFIADLQSGEIWHKRGVGPTTVYRWCKIVGGEQPL